MDIQNKCMGRTTVTFDPRMDKLIWWGKHLADLGLAPKQHGNLSFLTNRRSFIITRSGVELHDIHHDDFVEVVKLRCLGNDLAVYFRGKHKPSVEAFVHSVIYRYERPFGARVIFHLHDDAMVRTGDKLNIPTTTTTHRAGTVESVKAMEAFFLNLEREHEGVPYFILKDHGIMAVGASIHETGGIVLYHHGKVVTKKEARRCVS